MILIKYILLLHRGNNGFSAQQVVRFSASAAIVTQETSKVTLFQTFSARKSS